MAVCYTLTQMIEAHYVKSTVHKRLPKPHEKGANAEAGVVAGTLAGNLDNIYFAVA